MRNGGRCSGLGTWWREESLLPGLAIEQTVKAACFAPAGRQRWTNDKEIYMRVLISALAAAGFLMFALPGYSADEVKSGGTSTKPARAIDDGTVKSGGATDKPGRAIEEGSVKSGGASTKPGRAVEEGSVKSGGASTKPGRAVDGEKKAKKKKAKKPVAQ
jgi:cytochrome c peroxidase